MGWNIIFNKNLIQDNDNGIPVYIPNVILKAQTPWLVCWHMWHWSIRHEYPLSDCLKFYCSTSALCLLITPVLYFSIDAVLNHSLKMLYSLNLYQGQLLFIKKYNGSAKQYPECKTRFCSYNPHPHPHSHCYWRPTGRKTTVKTIQSVCYCAVMVTHV